jgi:hypothetical protein
VSGVTGFDKDVICIKDTRWNVDRRLISKSRVLDDASQVPDHFADDIIHGHWFHGLPPPMKIWSVKLGHDAGPLYRLGESSPAGRIRFGDDHDTLYIGEDRLDIASRILEVLSKIRRARLNMNGARFNATLYGPIAKTFRLGFAPAISRPIALSAAEKQAPRHITMQ